jgi:hypothetical protein
LRAARIILTEGKIMDLHEMSDKLKLVKEEAEAYAEENVRLRILIREILRDMEKFNRNLNQIIDDLERNS